MTTAGIGCIWKGQELFLSSSPYPVPKLLSDLSWNWGLWCQATLAPVSFPIRRGTNEFFEAGPHLVDAKKSRKRASFLSTPCFFKGIRKLKCICVSAFNCMCEYNCSHRRGPNPSHWITIWGCEDEMILLCLSPDLSESWELWEMITEATPKGSLRQGQLPIERLI